VIYQIFYPRQKIYTKERRRRERKREEYEEKGNVVVATNHDARKAERHSERVHNAIFIVPLDSAPLSLSLCLFNDEGVKEKKKKKSAFKKKVCATMTCRRC
jgi:hypothetical protein